MEYYNPLMEYYNPLMEYDNPSIHFNAMDQHSVAKMSSDNQPTVSVAIFWSTLWGRAPDVAGSVVASLSAEVFGTGGFKGEKRSVFSEGFTLW